jgi:hypothetical protein
LPIASRRQGVEAFHSQDGIRMPLVGKSATAR